MAEPSKTEQRWNAVLAANPDSAQHLNDARTALGQAAASATFEVEAAELDEDFVNDCVYRGFGKPTI